MKFYKILIISVLFVLPLMTIAAEAGSTGSFNGSTGGFNGSTGGDDKVKLCNPLGKISSFPALIEAVLNALFIIGVPVAVLFIVLAGFRFVWARGNPEKLKDAKRNLLFTIIGIAIFFGAVLITKVIVGTLERLGVDIPASGQSAGDDGC